MYCTCVCVCTCIIVHLYNYTLYRLKLINYMVKWNNGLMIVTNMKCKGTYMYMYMYVYVLISIYLYIILIVFFFLSWFLSVNQLAEVLRCAIEQETKILYELKLPGINFKINQVRIDYCTQTKYFKFLIL